jgi:hypothetical protein
LRKTYHKNDELLREVAGRLQNSRDSTNFGRCTSFANEIATSLSTISPREFDFEFRDITKHRFVHCKKTGILIDSSSMTGPMILLEGQPDRPKWSLDKNTSIFKRINRRGKTVEVLNDSLT